MLYIACRIRESQDKEGLPTFLDRTFTEEFNEKKPMEGIYSSNWRRYNPYQHGFPVPKDFSLPTSLLMICKGIKRFEPDLYFDNLHTWIVSEQFLIFLKEHHLLEQHYEQSKLTVLSTTKKSITNKQYFLLRFFRDDNDLIDFKKTPKIVSPKKPLTKHTPPTVYYPDLIFREGIASPAMLYIDEESLLGTFICTEQIKEMIEQKNFVGFNFYTLEGYVQERLYKEQYPSGLPSERPKPLP
ncbi:hypothetical protein DNI29_23410 [Hymenobacter sediminis]|uniref:Imm43 family immunity protein n=1 Tax=Hymenobacter sediminis TaxID=2218621 RepID=UPI000DA6AD42|nr:Imm43 family immunity protein [Hymenobacter sediminis]RPD43594.1 hypothetical protein DNI29_23410 [Hymenobacter sediminis]